MQESTGSARVGRPTSGDRSVHRRNQKGSEEPKYKQALQIAKDEEAVSVKPDIEGELADLKTKIAMLSKEMANLKESKKNVTLLSHPLWQEEEAYWQAAEEGIVTTKETIEESFDTMDLQLLQLPIPEEQTPNKSLILRNQEKLAALETARERAKGLLLKSLEQAGASS